MCALNRKQENQLIKYVNNKFIVGLGMLSRLIYNQLISELCRLTICEQTPIPSSLWNCVKIKNYL